MNLRPLALHARKNWLLVAALVTVGLLVGGISSAAASKQYKATTRLIVSPDTTLFGTRAGSSELSSAYEASIYTQQRAQSYALIASAPAVVAPAARELSLTTSASELASRVEATVVPTTSLIDVSVTADTADGAAKITNAIAQSLAREVASVDKIGQTGTAPVKLVVVDPATPPTSPTSPRLLRSLILGGLVGLILGIVLAGVRALFDSSIMSDEALAEVTGGPAIGAIVADRRLARRSLVVSDAPASAAADSFRQLRTGLQFVDLDSPPRAIVVTGVRPGAGATTIASNVALAFAQVGLRTVLVDANLRNPAASAAFGMADRPGLAEVLDADLDVADAIQAYDATSLEVLPAGRSSRAAGDVLGSLRLADVLERLEKRADIVVIDSPAVGSYPEALSISALTHGTVLVVRHSRTTRLQVEQAVQAVRSVHGQVLGTVLSAVPRTGLFSR